MPVLQAILFNLFFKCTLEKIHRYKYNIWFLCPLHLKQNKTKVSDELNVWASPLTFFPSEHSPPRIPPLYPHLSLRGALMVFPYHADAHRCEGSRQKANGWSNWTFVKKILQSLFRARALSVCQRVSFTLRAFLTPIAAVYLRHPSFVVRCAADILCFVHICQHI